MPNFQEHTKLNMNVYFVYLLICLFSYRLDLVIHSLGYLFGTFLGSPDLDMNDSRPDQHWGVLGLVWNVYARLSPHRGVSHVPVVGTALRAVVVLYLIVGFTYFTPYRNAAVNAIKSYEALYFFLSWCVADAIHIFYDRMKDIETKQKRDIRRIKINGYVGKKEMPADW